MQDILSSATVGDASPDLITAFEVRCPECGDPAEQYGCGGDEASVTVHADRDDYEDGNPLRTRGGFTEIRLTCPAGHIFRMVSANHKGTQYLGFAAGWGDFEVPAGGSFANW